MLRTRRFTPYIPRAVTSSERRKVTFGWLAGGTRKSLLAPSCSTAAIARSGTRTVHIIPLRTTSAPSSTNTGRSTNARTSAISQTVPVTAKRRQSPRRSRTPPHHYQVDQRRLHHARARQHPEQRRDTALSMK